MIPFVAMDDIPTPQEAANLLVALRRHQHHGSHSTVSQNGLSPQMVILRRWQSQRLAQTHADLLQSKRYGAACRFFLNDIYAPRDFSQRDHDIERMYRFMTRFLPGRILHPLAMAVELNTLTQDLDCTLLAALVDKLGMTDTLTGTMYSDAYRICDNYDDRLKQIDLIVEIGQRLGRLVRLPLIRISLRLARGPAYNAGWFDLQDFLERGLDAFKQMGNTTYFLDTIRKREVAILDTIFQERGNPFSM